MNGQLPILPAGAGAEPIRIMSLEDDEMSFHLLKRTVVRDARLNCDFYWVTTVEEALDLLQREIVHLCFIDYDLGVEDGFDLIRRLPPERSFTPCILLTGASDERLGDEALEHGFYDYLVKDRMDGQELRRAIRHALERRQTEEKLRNLALHDQLTGLYNRAAFIDHLDQMIRRRRRNGDDFGVIYLDIDRFKAINDAGGHQAGDAILIQIANRLRGLLRDTDIVARLGGDEFAICCQDIGELDDLAAIAGKLVRGLDDVISFNGTTFSTSCSLGIALSDDDLEQSEVYIKATDLAMYEAKRAGGNTFAVHSRVLSERFERRMQLERGLVRALAENRLSVAYQPIVDLRDGSVHAVEALARWKDPELGIVSPGEFIPIAESAGLINTVALAIFQKAFEGLHTLSKVPGFERTRVALNLSVRQLTNPALLPAISSLLNEAGIQAGQVEFEVTEGFFEGDEKTIIEQVWKLKELGARISVDDFGTGYSSLSRLKNYPIDAFKIDRSFVMGIDYKVAERRLCAAIIELGHALDIDVIGEGVESSDQLKILQSCGCGFAQGYLLSKPTEVSSLIDSGLTEIARAMQSERIH